MITTLRSETRKVAATGTIWWLLLTAAGIVALGTFLAVGLSDAEGDALLTDNQLRETMHGAAGGSILMAAVGVIGIAGEWRTGQINQTLMSTPRRWWVVTSKAGVYGALGVVYGVVASGIALVAAWGSYRAENLVFPFDSAAVWYSLLGVVLAAAVFGVLGVAVGALVRNPVIGVVVALGWFLLIEPILASASTTLGRWLPGEASTALTGFPNSDLHTPQTAGVLFAGIAVGLLILGAAKVQRADVTV
ncbi:hypothetical protein J4H86_04400 [Spiractinospora alimapuensis]|uniref:hypothetical protein n=1 Tax=Spiractinospora alimapuensis TaxID=2820884 RepID=UPI001F392E5F|nr:hypothetical protein [Spiractinospora alimapuensis]QVQ53051.1 hypothetical protein J4H86_04400 [Spiractinospora alimapuensis]